MSGFIPQITTRVSAELDTKELDDAIKLIESNPIAVQLYGDVKDYLLETKGKADISVDPLASTLSKRLQDNQYHRIKAYHRNTGMMANSVDITHESKGSYLVGNTATSYDGFPYPLAIETGRREVRPLNEDGWLRWWNKQGEIVFAKRSKAVKGDPYVEDSISMTDRQVDKVVDSWFNAVFG